MAKTVTPPSITKEQIVKIEEILGVALRKSDLSSEVIQRVLENQSDAMTAELVAVVRKYACDVIIIPTEMTVGGRTYDIFGFLKKGEGSVVGYTMVKRAKGMNANLGEDDGRHILKHQKDIPMVFRGKVVFVFPDWRRDECPEEACFVYWDDDGHWVKGCAWLGRHFVEYYQVLHRK